MRSVIQVFLEYKKDVIRDIEISSTSNLEELHYAIITAFGLEKNELASFYMTNEDFELLQEIPLLSIDEKENPMLRMNEVIISSILTKQDSQLLYVYDFMKMWRFLITLTEEKEETISQPKCIKSVGEIPEDAPKITFEEEKEFDPFDNSSRIIIGDKYNKIIRLLGKPDKVTKKMYLKEEYIMALFSFKNKSYHFYFKDDKLFEIEELYE